MTSDAQLIERWRAGDAQAGMALFERYYAPVERFFRNKVDDGARDDLVQQTFLACTEASARLRDAASFRSYLFSIAYRVLADHFRRLSRTRQRESGSPVDLDAMSAAQLDQSPEAAVALRQEQRLLLEGLRRIPLNYQVALELRYWEQCTAAAIAEILGIPLGTAKTRLRSGRRLLETTLTEIASSDALLRSTLDNLDGWASRIRGMVPLASDKRSRVT